MRPRRFRIKDFRSIVDSGDCWLSKDNITVLAGQNESGKTAILCALRDFDLDPGTLPKTSDYTPDGREDAQPRVSVEFELEADDVSKWLVESKKEAPPRFQEYIRVKRRLWVHRDLPTGKYTFDDEVIGYWPDLEEKDQPHPVKADDNSEAGAQQSEGVLESDSPVNDEPDQPAPATPEDVAVVLRGYWPYFIYFDSFENRLPKDVDVDLLLPATQKVQKEPGQPPVTRKSAPEAVQDFITLSGMDPVKVKNFANEDKALSNYLQQRGATITGNFLSYWKSGASGKEQVQLVVRGGRSEDGALKLRFYVNDGGIDQYPEQRSKGFLWFLSFYLTLTAARKNDPDRSYLVLIDEPGSYLHERAQRDILSLLEKEIIPNQIIYSTHSRPLLPATCLHRLRLVAKRADKGTIIYDRLTHPELRDEGFKDTLSPILDAVGLDLREGLRLARDRNLLVEGISDRLYLDAWSRRYDPTFAASINVFPGSSASTVPLLASLFIGWGLGFGGLLDRDGPGEDAKRRLVSELGVSESRIVQPRDGVSTEDLFAPADFQALLRMIDATYAMKPNEIPSKAIKRMTVDKVLLARTYAESAAEMTLSGETETAIRSLLRAIQTAVPATSGDERL